MSFDPEHYFVPSLKELREQLNSFNELKKSKKRN